MKGLQRITVLALVLISCTSIFAQNSGEAIVKRCVANFNNAPSLTADFTIALESGSEHGKFTLCKNLFKIETPTMAIWFDGKTQWTFLKANNEVNITEPTGEELMESNPFALLSSFSTQYNCRLLHSTSASDIIELTSKIKNTPIKSARVTISKSTGWPTTLTVTLDNGTVTSVAVQGITMGNPMQATSFRFDKKMFPTAEIIDLR